MKTNGNVFGGVLLVAGTCIGAGMLSLPVVTAASGFFPTLCAFIIVWFFSNSSALAYLEVSLRFKGEINLISMVERTLGPMAKWIAWVCFILLLYSLMAAYTAGGSSMLAKSLGLNIHDKSMGLTIALSFALPFALLVYFGAYWVDHLNRLLVLGLVITFAAMCIFTAHIGPANQFHAVGETKYLLFTFPILITAFGYHLLIPTLKTYLQENVNQLRKVVIVGTILPLIVYTIWELLVLTLIPTWGQNGLVQMLHGKQDSTTAMILALDSHGDIITFFVTWFCFFALTSSFLGVGLAISDFFRDALHIHKTHKGRVLSSFLTFGPPVLYTIFYPQGFLLALRYAGMFAAILLIIYPVMMAWNARYVSRIPGKYQMFGGKLILAITLLFGLLVVCADILHHLGYLPIPHN